MEKESKTKASDRLNFEKGFVSLLILLVIIFLSWIGVEAFYKTSSQERIIRYEAQRIKASFLADNGLEWARASLTKDPSWEGGTKLFCNGKVEVKVEKEEQAYKIISRSKSDGAVQVRYGFLSQGDDGVFVLISYGELFD